LKFKQFAGKFVEFYRNFWKAITILLLLTLLGQALNLIAPYIYGKILDALVAGKSAKDIMLVAVLSLGVYTLQTMVVDRYFYWYNINKLRIDAHQYISEKTLDKVMTFSVGQDINQNSGVKQDVITRGEHSVATITNTLLYEVFPVVIQVILFSAALFFINLKLGFVVLAGMIAHLAANIYINCKFKEEAGQIEEKEIDNNKIRSEILRNIETVKLNSQEERVISEYREDSFTVNNLSKKLWSKYTLYSSCRDMIIGLTKFAVIATGAVCYSNGSCSAGDLLIFFSWSSSALGKMTSIGTIQRILMTAYASVKNYFVMMDVEPDVRIVSNPVKPGKYLGQIEFKNVSFVYPKRNYIEEKNKKETKLFEGRHEALSNANFIIRAGQKAAFVGHSGSGKSTIIKLLMRAYDPTAGQILIDGHDLRLLDLRDFRNSVGIVEQQILLFDNTLRYNITFPLNGKSELVSDEMLDKVSRLSRVSEFYHRLENGFDTIIGERGVKLSGGQCKRVGIARALIKDPSILILDEATSDLDAQNDAIIQQAMKEVAKERTTIIIAHRLSTIKDADKIFVVNGGKIVGEGKHAELMKSCFEYQNLVHSQVHVF